MNALDALANLGALSAIDIALGRLIAEKSREEGRADDGALVGLAAALASAALAAGHSCLPLASAPAFVAARLPDENTLPALPTPEAWRAALRASALVAPDAQTPAALVLDAHDRVYLRRYYVYERTVAARLRERLDVARDFPPIAALDPDDADPDQRIATALAQHSRLLVITGGPGSGKTTTVLRLLAAITAQHAAAGLSAPRIALAAPTGKAAARLSESLRDRPLAPAGLPGATTLHRLLGAMPGRSRPRHDRANVLPFDLVVVDEASMLDLALAARLCDALAPETRLVLLGDRDQLAAVEAGSVFGALCAAVPEPNRYAAPLAAWLARAAGVKVEKAAAPPPLANALVELRGNHRFGAAGAIGRFAQAIRRGDAAAAATVAAESEAIRIEPFASGARIAIQRVIAQRHALADLATDPAAAVAAASRFRALCALREGPAGSLALNDAVERELRRRAGVAGDAWFAGRQILIVANDHRLGLFNGDTGVALATGQGGALEVWFRDATGRLRALPPPLLPAHESAFALTVHKAQGSEFDEVLIVLGDRDARVLSRELLYTAVTRARHKVEVWTSEDVLAATLARATVRWSGLADALAV
ncbi:MAG TPA: exodeoxyribonuclease V subunit alpha [Rudaea sp.]